MKFVEGIIFAVQSIHVTLGRCINAITESLSNIDIEYKYYQMCIIGSIFDINIRSF